MAGNIDAAASTCRYVAGSSFVFGVVAFFVLADQQFLSVLFVGEGVVFLALSFGIRGESLVATITAAILYTVASFIVCKQWMTSPTGSPGVGIANLPVFLVRGWFTLTFWKAVVDIVELRAKRARLAQEPVGFVSPYQRPASGRFVPPQQAAAPSPPGPGAPRPPSARFSPGPPGGRIALPGAASSSTRPGPPGTAPPPGAKASGRFTPAAGGQGKRCPNCQKTFPVNMDRCSGCNVVLFLE